MAGISIAVNEQFLGLGVKSYINWDFTRCPHMVIFGATGSGKTYLLKLILGRIALRVPNAHLTICDFKGDEDFSFLMGCPAFHRFTDVQNGLDAFGELLKRRQQGEDKSIHHFLIFDEYAAYLNFLDKKQAELAKQALATILMLGRSFNLHVILSQQRVDASYFANSRDNFSAVIGLGRLSRESADMMFSDYKDEISRIKGRGEGSCLLGNDFSSRSWGLRPNAPIQNRTCAINAYGFSLYIRSYL